jgi:hypothetical protein
MNTEPRLYLVRYFDGRCWWNWGWVKTKRDATQRAKQLQTWGYQTEILPPKGTKT